MDTTKRPIQLGETQELRYGENPWQSAAFFTQHSKDPLEIGKFVLERGEIPSYVNLTDLDRALMTLSHVVESLAQNAFHLPSFVALAVKHGNCCGAGYGFSELEAIRRMIDGDRQAIMGALVITNFGIGAELAHELRSYHLEKDERPRIFDAVVAECFTIPAMDALERKAGKCRLLSNSALGEPFAEWLDGVQRCRQVRKGYLVQDPYDNVTNIMDPTIAVYGDPEVKRHNLDLALALALCRTSNSNTVTLVKDGMLIGQGVGQTRRDRAARLALSIARECGHDPAGAVAVSDSFFPFDDGVKPLIDAKVKLIFSTSGAIRDKEVQQACVEGGVTLCQLPDKTARMFFGH